MPILEDSDPGDPPGGYFVTELAPSAIDAAAVAEQVLTRLQQMPEVPQSLAEQARSRWESDRDLSALLAWLEQKMRPYEEPDVIECDCGTLLVDPATWSGRAVVVCDRCGSRFGVESRGTGAWTMWALPAEK